MAPRIPPLAQLINDGQLESGALLRYLKVSLRFVERCTVQNALEAWFHALCICAICTLVSPLQKHDVWLQGKNQLIGWGWARPDGVEVEGVSKLLNFSAFEAHCGSKLHRPSEYTFSSTSISLQAGCRISKFCTRSVMVCRLRGCSNTQRWSSIVNACRSLRTQQYRP